jgi:hypothetical protein
MARKRKEKKRKPHKSVLLKKTLAQKLQTTKKSPLLKGEKQQDLEWLDLERNAEIYWRKPTKLLQKTEVKNAALSLYITSN